MPRKAEKSGEHKHHFHGCLTAAARWRKLGEILSMIEDTVVLLFQPLDRHEKKLDHILALLKPIAQEIHHMAGELDALEAEVSANTDAEAAAVVLLGKLHDMLVAAGTDPAKLAALTSQLSTSKDALAAAIVANTPAEG